MTAPPSPLPPKLILQTLNRGDGLLGLRPHGKLGPRGDRVSLLRLARWPADPAALEQWQALPLHPVDVEMLQWRDASFGRGLTPCWTLEQEDLFPDFAADEVPRLRQLGWEVDVLPGFAHHSVAIDAWSLEIQPEDEEPVDVQTAIAPGTGDRLPTLALSRRKGSWMLSLGVTVQGQRVDLAPMIWDLLRKDRRWLYADAIAGIADDAIISLKAPGGRRLHSTAAPLKRLMLNLLDVLVAQRSRRGPVKLSSWEAARLAALDMPDSRWQVYGADELRTMWERLRDAGPPPASTAPEGLGITLRPYQLQGLAWLQYLARQELGGFLADDMGLGKTAQALAHLMVEKQAGRLSSPALVVAPTSLIFNWTQEAARVAPDLRVATLSDPAERAQVMKRLGDIDLLLCSYGLAWREVRALSKPTFSVLVLDEAQAVKNPRSRAARALRRLKANQRLVLTGTPLENTSASSGPSSIS